MDCKCSFFHNVFFQRRQKALLWNKGLIKGLNMFFMHGRSTGQEGVVINRGQSTSLLTPPEGPYIENSFLISIIAKK